MPSGRYLKLNIGDAEVQVTNPEDLPISIDFGLEDTENFQLKTSSEALSIKVPATLLNDKAANTFRNADISDLTDGQVFRSNQPFTIDENGVEIMKGKAFLTEAEHDDRPQEYQYDLYGDNADWKIDLEEATLYDFLKDISFDFTKANIIDSWSFNGNDINKPYVFAPVKYRAPFGGYKINDTKERVPDNSNVEVSYLKPSLSKYWIIYKAFKSIGYRLKSDFMDSEFFRRQVMPWTWGNFLSSEGTKFDIHRFRAKSASETPYNLNNTDTHGYILFDLDVSNDSTQGMFDNNSSYEYDPSAKEMKWTYKPPNYGPLEANLSIALSTNTYAGNNSDIDLKVVWYKNGVQQMEENIVHVSTPFIQAAPQTDAGLRRSFFKSVVVEGDEISVKVFVSMKDAKISSGVWIEVLVDEFQLDFFRIPVGGTIDFSNYTGLKKYKFLDYLRGVIDEFNFSIKTDPINKVVLMEPTHTYSVNNNPIEANQGYFVDDFIDWNNIKDNSKKWKLINFNDYARELIFCYKYDSNDGILKVVQDRNINILGAGKYVFPERFKTGKKEIENRFFSAVMHYEVDDWKDITGTAPQVVCLIPENLTNTSNSEASNTFLPKSCYYKGLVSGVGGWRFDGEDQTQLPFLFAVNYKDGGVNDPILSYSDERIADGDGFIIGKGLLKRFYWQRLAIMRNGQYYKTSWFRLKNIHLDKFHREYKSFNGHRWELVNINGYQPLKEQSTSCFLRRWAPVTIADFDNTFPSAANVLDGNSSNPLDIKYAQLIGLKSDIPSS